MSRTIKDKRSGYGGKKGIGGVGRRVKEEARLRKKSPKLKDLEINNGKVLDKMLVDRWNHD